MSLFDDKEDMKLIQDYNKEIEELAEKLTKEINEKKDD